MNIEMFLLGLMGTSTIASLFTEAIKKELDNHKKPYCANALAGICNIVVALLLSVGHIILKEIVVTPSTIVYVVALILLSWLCSMVGYDKVIQALSQLKKAE